MSDSATSTVASSSCVTGAGRRLWRMLRLGIAVALLCASVDGREVVVDRLAGPVPRGERLSFSTLVVDRDGRLLRPYTTPDGRWRLPATREDVDPRFLAMLFAYEDRRFLSHRGVDPLALGRALSQLIVNGRIVSGASTLTMQVARLLEPRSERSFIAKLRQIGARGPARAHARARTRSWRSTSASRPTAAISRASAPPRWRISERSRGGCRWRSPRCWWHCRSRRKCAVRTVPLLPHVRRVIACSIGWRRLASFQPTRSSAPSRRPSRKAAGQCRCWRRIPLTRSSPRRRPAPSTASPSTRPFRRISKSSRASGRARSAIDLGRHPRGRQRDRRGACAGGVVRLFRRQSRRPGRHDAGAALAGLRAQAVHLRPRLRGWAHPSRNADRRPPDPLRQLRARRISI